MSAPTLTVTIEPFESGSVVYGPLAPRTLNDSPKGQLSFVFTITNKEKNAVHLNAVTISFTSPPMVNTSIIPVDVTIDPNKSTVLYFPPANNIILPDPAPIEVKVAFACDGFSTAVNVKQTLTPYQGDGSGYLFPAKPSELGTGEFWQGRSSAHGPAGGGVQLFGYDMDIQAFDGSQWSPLKPGGSWAKNEDYRIWGKSVVAMKDGTVQSWANDIPTNPNPPADLSPPGPVEGNHFYIQHGTDLVLYAHMQIGTLKPNLLAKGASVKAGDVLGLAGNSGNSSGPHLHIHAIKGTAPWQGPPRPILFRDCYVVDQSVLQLPSSAGLWTNVQNQGLPSVPSAIWPSAIPPNGFQRHASHYLAIDPLALILSSQAYILLTLPDPPPLDVWTRQVRDIVTAMSPQERMSALKRARAVAEQVKVLQKELGN
jgi:hypothetical protein